MVSIKRPGLNFPQKVFIKRPGLIQVLRVHENQGSLDYLKKVSIKLKLKGIQDKNSIAYFCLTNFSLLFAVEF